MKIFFENELVAEQGKTKKELIFVPNLKMFVENNKGLIHFSKVERGSEQYFSAISDNKEWREVEGIENSSDLEKVLNELEPRSIYRTIKYNLTRCYYNAVKKEFEQEFENKKFKKRQDPCYRDEELYNSLQKSTHSGLSINACDPNKIYHNVMQLDKNGYYGGLMCSQNYPLEFNRAKQKDFETIISTNANFFGDFSFEIYQESPALRCLLGRNGRYNKETKEVFVSCFGITLNDIMQVCGINLSTLRVHKLWQISMGKLPENIIFAIKWAKKNELKNKKKYKRFREMLYGQCLKSRFYKTEYVWNEEEQNFDVVTKNFVFLEERQQAFYREFHYAWGVYTCALGMHLLLQDVIKLGSDFLYCDVDGIKFLKSNKNPAFVISNELGDYKDEGLLSDFKAVDLKWYCGNGVNGLKLACSGANKEIVSNYLLGFEKPVEKFGKEFPNDIKPFKIIRKVNGKIIAEFVGSDYYD